MARIVPPIASIRSRYSIAPRSMASVRLSIYSAPPVGSAVLMTPLSAAMICWVRSASRADSSVGSERASSRALVCRDCAPPRTAAMASIDAALGSDDLLGAERKPGRFLGRERESFIARVGVQGLRATEDGRHGLDRRRSRQR